MTFFSNLPNPFSKKPEPDAVQQQHQNNEQRSLAHYKTWPVFLVYKKRKMEQILQAVGDQPAPPTPADSQPGPLTPDQLLAQIRSQDEDSSRTAAEAAPQEQDPTDQLLARIEAAAVQETAGPPAIEELPIQAGDTRPKPAAGSELQADRAASEAAAGRDAPDDVDISYADIPDSEDLADGHTQSPDEGILAAFEALEASQGVSATQPQDPDIDDILDQLPSITQKLTSEVS